MMDLPRPQTTSSGWLGKGDVLDWPKPYHSGPVSKRPEIVGLQFGWAKIISSRMRYRPGWRHPIVLISCTGCGETKWTLWGNLKQGKTRGCQHCSQPRQIPRELDRVLTSAKQRCTNPRDAGRRRYVDRGIRFNFESVLAAGLWVMENLGPRPEGAELDRIDNNGHYEPGNLRWVTRARNMANRECTRIPEWMPQDWPYARSVVSRKLREGLSREEILADAQMAIDQKRKNWRGIQQWFTTYSTVGQETDSP